MKFFTRKNPLRRGKKRMEFRIDGRVYSSQKLHTRREWIARSGWRRSFTKPHVPADTCSAACPNKYLVFAYSGRMRDGNGCGARSRPFKPPQLDAGAKRLSKLCRRVPGADRQWDQDNNAADSLQHFVDLLLLRFTIAHKKYDTIICFTHLNFI